MMHHVMMMQHRDASLDHDDAPFMMMHHDASEDRAWPESAPSVMVRQHLAIVRVSETAGLVAPFHPDAMMFGAIKPSGFSTNVAKRCLGVIVRDQLIGNNWKAVRKIRKLVEIIGQLGTSHGTAFLQSTKSRIRAWELGG